MRDDDFQINMDFLTVEGFGEEWSSFDQSCLTDGERKKIFDDYFSIFPWHMLPEGGGVGADIGCGSGRWASVVAGSVDKLYCVDASPKALDVARRCLSKFDNVIFYNNSVDDLPFEDGTLDFAYSLGVLHHVPNTQSAIKSIASKLKPGAPFLVYLYYAFDNRPIWFRFLWCLSDLLRRVISRLPFRIRLVLTQIIAASVYWPLSRMALLLDNWGRMPRVWPLAYYRDKTFYVMRTDALDRFGTRLERRFTATEIRIILEQEGFDRIVFSNTMPFWCVAAVKSSGVE